MAHQTTLKDVAQAAGVAVATASHALNGTGTINRATAERIRQIAAEIGYHPDLRAAHLRRQQTSTVGVLIPTLRNPFYSELAEALEAAGRARGYSLLSGTTNYDPQLVRHYIDLFLGQRCAGIIIIHGREMLDDIVQAGVPTVIVNAHLPPDQVRVPMVEVDTMHGVYSGIMHLVRLGHRRIGLVTFPSSDLRNHGYRRALHDGGLAYDPDLVVETDLVSRLFGAHHDALRLLQTQPDITAVMATADVIAFGVIRAAYLAGRRIPDDLAVVGFDNISLAADAVPALTTVAQPLASIAQHALDLLLEQIQQGGLALDRQRVTLDTELIIRESCGGLPRSRTESSTPAPHDARG